MSEDDRMERARRLRELREDRRAEAAGDEADEPTADATAIADAVERVGDAGAEVPSPEQLDAATAEDDEEPADDGVETQVSTRVLEFALGGELYCIDIDYVEEIVTDKSVTRVPNTPPYVEGVVDLRGRITTILDPTVLMDVDGAGPGELLVVFDAGAVADEGHIGWAVDDVRQVAPVTEAEVTDAPTDEEYVKGVVDRADDESLVVWTSPELALEAATDEEAL